MAEYIDREALIKRLTSAGAISDWGLYLIKDEPAADVRPERHGEWVEKLMAYECSACRRELITGIAMETLGYKFCPYCGAKMERGEQQDNE